MRYSIPCSPATPCHQHRHCDYCAALRQRKIAEIAATRHKGGVLTFATFTKLRGPAIVHARQLHPGTGGLWSVEAGTKMGGMHVNILFESQSELFADDIAAAAAIHGAEVWAQTVPAHDIRNVAAYINKRAGMPSKLDYNGNLSGTYGAWRSVRQVAQQQRIAPLLAAASHEDELRRLGISAPVSASTDRSQINRTGEQALTREQYRALAVDNLPILRQLLES
jgi:hypothetical protein